LKTKKLVCHPERSEGPMNYCRRQAAAENLRCAQDDKVLVNARINKIRG
jgi:hypothetical protein